MQDTLWQAEFTAPLWVWSGETAGAWHFLTLPRDLSARVRAMAGRDAAFGSVRVRAQIGAVAWSTSLFPSTERQAFLLPVKADVRRKAGLRVGADCRVAIGLPG
jgi:hypothetical protein